MILKMKTPFVSGPLFFSSFSFTFKMIGCVRDVRCATSIWNKARVVVSDQGRECGEVLEEETVCLQGKSRQQTRNDEKR